MAEDDTTVKPKAEGTIAEGPAEEPPIKTDLVGTISAKAEGTMYTGPSTEGETEECDDDEELTVEAAPEDYVKKRKKGDRSP